MKPTLFPLLTPALSSQSILTSSELVLLIFQVYHLLQTCNDDDVQPLVPCGRTSTETSWGSASHRKAEAGSGGCVLHRHTEANAGSVLRTKRLCSIDQASVSEIRVYFEDRPDHCHWRYFDISDQNKRQSRHPQCPGQPLQVSSLHINFMVDLELLMTKYEVTWIKDRTLVILYGAESPELASPKLRSSGRCVPAAEPRVPADRGAY